ncbi:hypothetical protein ACIB24_12475 [Spongisporangium articulatum]|uniref:Lipoprotein n=1 Tax=Spongisporangium articulatum TaxID=3362603 RepID=A0ABW8ANC0_9ACTN
MGAAAIGIFLLAGCSAYGSSAQDGALRPAAAISTSTPSPTVELTALQRGYIKQITALDPAFAEDPSRTISQTKRVCAYSAKVTRTSAQVIAYTRKTMTVASARLSSSAARDLLNYGNAYICTAEQKAGTRARVANEEKRRAEAERKAQEAARSQGSGSGGSGGSGGSSGGGSTSAGVTPGAFCKPAGAVRIGKNGKTYTCKGPGQPRWRR